MNARAASRGPVDDLRAVMVEHSLTQREVSELAGVSHKTVESWLATPGSASHRAMNARHLTLLRAVLPGFLAARKTA